ncbi:hypothetical protein GGX14DRAFT_570149 [Mycena pura]|uniref:Uncharacterized protein n=1 Tax=Mycena pura TaxID=153505 RepID=A0AAD6YB09_9AGAR|nr:hypothetical protein GGX14DRAFT_570149 [Mycena pura]
MVFLTGTLSLFLLAYRTNSLPAGRQDTGGISVGDSLGSMYSMYLESQNVQNKAFYPLFGGETAIGFAGVGAQGADLFEMNSLLFQTADRLPHIANQTSSGQLMFSIHYMHFIQALENVTTVTDVQKTELNDLQINMTAACVTELGKATDDAYKGYQSLHGTAKITDDIFIQFATENYGEYKQAMLDCDDAKNKYDNGLNKFEGDDRGIIQSAIYAMEPIINAEDTLYPGVNMPTSGPSNATEGGAVGGQFSGTFDALYAMPSLNSTLAIWQQGPTDAAPALTWNSEHDSKVSITGGQSASVSGQVLWDSASASENSNMSFVLTQAQSSVISFGGIELVDVVRGAWFDGFRCASAVGTPASDDPAAKEHKAAFETYFGTAANPGPTAMYNDKALIVYKPVMNFTFASEQDYSLAREAQAKAQASALFWSVSASAEGHDNSTTFDDARLTISFNPNTLNAYIVGFVMHNYWDDVSNTTISVSR